MGRIHVMSNVRYLVQQLIITIINLYFMNVRNSGSAAATHDYQNYNQYSSRPNVYHYLAHLVRK